MTEKRDPEAIIAAFIAQHAADGGLELDHQLWREDARTLIRWLSDGGWSITSVEDEACDRIWGVGGWERHECKYDERVAAHSIHFHHDQHLCHSTDQGWECREARKVGT